MTQDDQIPLDILKGMDPQQINILLVQGFNSQVRELKELKQHVQSYSELLEKKIGREEFSEFKAKINGRVDTADGKIKAIEEIHQDGDIRKKMAFNIGKYFWIIILAFMNLLQFFYTIGKNS